MFGTPLLVGIGISPGPRGDVVDVTGVGDAFAGGLMVALAEETRQAIDFATCVAALSVTRIGVVNALPSRDEADRLWQETFG